ncbi:MAG: hypothetical protein V4702_00800 [Patescibacteria group bacterium]
MAIKKLKKTNVLQRRKSFSGLQITIFALLFGAMAAFTLLQGFAAPRGGGGGPAGTTTISQPILVTDKDSNGVLNWNDKIRFNVSSTQTAKPFVNLKCYQNGVLVSQGTEGYFAGVLDDGVFGLASPAWVSGAADCTADVKWGDAPRTKQRDTILASVSFRVCAQNATECPTTP